MADRKATAFTEAVILVTDFIPFIKVGDSGNFRDSLADILDIYNARTATLTNKTLDLADNTVTGTKALFDTALSDDDFAYIGQANVFTQNQEIEKTGAIPLLTFDRPEVLADNTTITRINFKGFDDASATETYAQIRVVVASDAAANPEGCLDLRVDEAGTLTNYITLNDLGGGDIDLRKPVNFNSQNVSNMGTLNTHTVPGGTSTFALVSDNLSVFAATTSLQLLGVISDETGSGLLVFNNSPTFITPALGTPASGTMTNVTGTSGITGLGALTQALDMNTQILQFVDANQTITNSGGNFVNDVAIGQVHLWRINNVTEMQLSATALAMQGNSILLGGSNIDNIRNLIHDQSVSGTDIDFNENEQQTISIAVNTTFTTANRATGKSKTLKILTDGTLRTLDFPAWKFVGTKPADQAASKTGILTVTCFGTADTDIVAAYAVEA